MHAGGGAGREKSRREESARDRRCGFDSFVEFAEAECGPGYGQLEQGAGFAGLRGEPAAVGLAQIQLRVARLLRQQQVGLEAANALMPSSYQPQQSALEPDGEGPGQ